MDVFDVIQKRFSVRSYQDKPVEQEKLNIILEAAQSAPTACNLQSFKIIVAKPKRRELLKIYHQNWFADAYVIGVAQLKINAGWERQQKLCRRRCCYCNGSIILAATVGPWHLLDWSL